MNYEERLGKQGVKIRYQAWRGQSCAFVQLPAQTESEKNAEEEQTAQGSVEEPVPEPVLECEGKPDSSEAKPFTWTPERETRLRELHRQGLTPKEIAVQFGCSVFVIAAKFRYLSKPQILQQKKPDPKPRRAAGRQENHDDGVIKEFLEAASMLYPSHRRASAFLLKQAADKMES